MIVIGVDVHKHSLTAVAVDELGRTLSEWTGALGSELSAWARSLAQVPLGALDRGIWLERLGRQLARAEQTTQVRIARELLGRCRALTREIVALERELQVRTETLAPRLLELAGCGALSAAKLLCEIGP